MHDLAQVEMTRQHADHLVREKARAARQIEDEYRLFVKQARGELRQHIDDSRSIAESR